MKNTLSLVVRFCVVWIVWRSSIVLASEIVVSPDGSADYESISEAIDSLGMYNYQRVRIFVRNGVYEEKIAIRQDYVTLVGESRESTILRLDLPRSLYLENPDAIGPAIINIYGDDIVLENMTIENTQAEKRVHAFAVYGEGTRTIIQDCNVWSNGGDTVSLWNYKEGMYFHARCDFRGGVDFVCPRGWCYIEDSSFFCTYETAAIWHAGPYSKSQKFVLRNCSFDGAKEFDLGRHHYEAQFYLLDCSFSNKVSDQPIYYVRRDDPSKNRPFVWGPRYYFESASGSGSGKEWMKDNLKISSTSITPSWTFDEKWNPVSGEDLAAKSMENTDGGILVRFLETVAVDGKPSIELLSGELFHYVEGAGSDTLFFTGSSSVTSLEGAILVDGSVIGNTATSSPRRWLLE